MTSVCISTADAHARHIQQCLRCDPVPIIVSSKECTYISKQDRQTCSDVIRCRWENEVFHQAALCSSSTRLDSPSEQNFEQKNENYNEKEKRKPFKKNIEQKNENYNEKKEKNLWPPPQSPVFTASSLHYVVVISAAAAAAYNVAFHCLFIFLGSHHQWWPPLALPWSLLTLLWLRLVLLQAAALLLQEHFLPLRRSHPSIYPPAPALLLLHNQTFYHASFNTLSAS